MHARRSLLSFLRALPERTRFFLVGSLLVIVAIFIFMFWAVLSSSRLASISAPLQGGSEASPASTLSFDQERTVFGEIKDGFRDMASLFQGGFSSFDIPSLSGDESSREGIATSSPEGEETPVFPESTPRDDSSSFGDQDGETKN